MYIDLNLKRGLYCGGVVEKEVAFPDAKLRGKTEPNFIWLLLKAQKVVGHDRIMLTRIRLTAKLQCLKYNS